LSTDGLPRIQLVWVSFLLGEVTLLIVLSLVTMLTTIGLNLATVDPYSGIMLTSRRFHDTYMPQHLKPAVLSTVIADSGSIASYIIPWNVHSAYVAGALGVCMTYIPYAFLSCLLPR